MSMDLNVKKATRNAFRITSKRGRTCIRIRVPGGHLAAGYLDIVKRIATDFGNGTVHLTIRQGFEIPGIPFERMEEVNRVLRGLLEGIEAKLGVEIPDWEGGYPAAGTRNVSACIGNRVCPFANYDTTVLAGRIEAAIYPNHHHIKVALTGCPNDCIKAHTQDFGVIGQAEVEIDPDRCIGCEACAVNCRRRVTGAIEMREFRAVRDPRRCIGCGECVLKCPTRAWTRNPTKYYRVIILGRTGKRNPRLAATFLELVTEDVVLGMLRNVYGFIDEHIDKSLPKEHLGYIVDRVGYPIFRDTVLKNLDLGPKGRVAERLDFHGYWYERDCALK